MHKSENNGKNALTVGDTIQCRDKEDLVETMNELMELGIETDFKFEKDGERGLWLIVEKIS